MVFIFGANHFTSTALILLTYVYLYFSHSIELRPMYMSNSAAHMSCESLTIAPVIPNSVTDMRYTFNRCKSLITAPTIPNSVMNLTNTFEQCTSLTGNIEINANNNIINYGGCFKSTIKPISISGSCSELSQLAKTATNGNVTVSQ